MSNGQSTLLAILASNWPTLAGALMAAVFLFSFLTNNGFIDSVVHKSAFDQLVTQNSQAHTELKTTITEIKDDIKTVLREQNEQGRKIERLDARRQ
jgi:hypothetical protein